jgi:hypothetical protein
MVRMWVLLHRNYMHTQQLSRLNTELKLSTVRRFATIKEW